MLIDIIGGKSNAIFDPLRTWKGIGKDKNLGENISRGVLGTVDAVLEIPFSLLEHLFWRVPVGMIDEKKLKNVDDMGKIDVPNKFETENLFHRVEQLGLRDDQTTILRQNFIDQYTEKYNLHRLDFNFTPLLNNSYYDFRFMDINILFKITSSVETTDVFPQTKWVKEGLKVGDHVYLNAKGKYSGGVKLKSSLPSISPADVELNPAKTDVEIVKGRDYFYSVQYETQIPTIEGFSLSDGFGWRLRGTYEKYIDSGTKQLTAILLVPKETTEAEITGEITCGITNKDRKDPEYPSTKKLKYGHSTIKPVPLFFGG